MSTQSFSSSIRTFVSLVNPKCLDDVTSSPDGGVIDRVGDRSSGVINGGGVGGFGGERGPSVGEGLGVSSLYWQRGLPGFFGR